MKIERVITVEQEKIGRFIAENRKAKGLTQIEFAEKLGVSNKSVSRWETGKNMPDVSLFLPLCELLGISVNELIVGEHITEEESKNSDEILVEVIKSSGKKLRTVRIIMYLVAILLNAAFTIAVPLTATPSDAMAVPLMAIIGGALSALLLSFSNIKPAWQFIFIPISATELLIGSAIYCSDPFDYGLQYATVIAFIELTIILLSMGIKKIIRMIECNKKAE